MVRLDQKLDEPTYVLIIEFENGSDAENAYWAWCRNAPRGMVLMHEGDTSSSEGHGRRSRNLIRKTWNATKNLLYRRSGEENWDEDGDHNGNDSGDQKLNQDRDENADENVGKSKA